jgi:serine/threonine-protein kinase HipA
MAKTAVIEVFCNSRRVGKLALTADSLCAFEYDAEFLKNGFSLSPYFLPLQSGVFVAKRQPFRGNFGVFEDSLPDGWGALILDRYLKNKGINPDKLTILQRLSLVGITGRGALEFFPNQSETAKNAPADFELLSAETEKILTSDYAGDSLETLYRYGGSSGGARPKIFVKIDAQEWLVKFRATTDPAYVGKTEYDYSLLAKRCGIEMPETRLFEDKYFGVQRFDRTETGKIHTVSAAGLLNADYRLPALDYTDLLKVCLNLTRDFQEVYKLFRLMIFNIIISNRDDHAKNFAFQCRNGKWQLSPAYDLLPSNGFNGWHTTTINGKGEATLKDIMQISNELTLSKKRVREILEQVMETCNSYDKMNFKIN